MDLELHACIFSLPNESRNNVQTVLHTARTNISAYVAGSLPDDSAAPGSCASFWTTALQPAKRLQGMGEVKTGTLESEHIHGLG